MIRLTVLGADAGAWLDSSCARLSWGPSFETNSSSPASRRFISSTSSFSDFAE